MDTALTGAVELLDRSLAYTRLALAGVGPEHAALPTPCHGWPLRRLLEHMDDALDAYIEATTGRVGLDPSLGDGRVESVRAKACALLAWWLDPPVDVVEVGDRRLAAEKLLSAAALEVTLHGWDVHATLGRPTAVPVDLAAPLFDVAVEVAVGPLRPACFAPPVSPPPGDSESTLLLGFLGRSRDSAGET
ncbi:maleylpyruvate isomerase family mycothiol-dependent enzyme [Nocardioides sp.]|uniref:maleylpyruvate isomerase family mycothiol-dependent enzyme n=1 Tax=Nocardioides sp. TaxID=35761 RepID=UPI002ED62037